MHRLKIIHVGLGKWGGNGATEVLPNHPDVMVTGYVDRDPVALATVQTRNKLPDTELFSSLEDALRAVEADAVSIAVPIALHAPIARQALEAGKHVVVEKPFTATLAEARELVAMASARRLVLMVSQNYRFYPATRMAAALAQDTSFGRLVSVKVDFRRNAYAERSTNLAVPDPLFADMAVHHFDLMRMLIGEDPIDVVARSWNPASPYEGDPAGAAILRFPSLSVSYRGSWVDMGPQTPWAGEWQLDFERGGIAMTSRGDQLDRTRRDSVTILRPNAPAEQVQLPPMPLFDRAGVLHAFSETIRTGVEPPHFPAGRINIGTLAIVQATLQSAASGGAPVRLDSL
jgi:predicted dehydrogenase